MKIVITLQEHPSNPGKETWLMRAEEVRGKGVYDTPDSCIARVIRLWLIAAMGTQLLNFLGLQAEDKNIFLADLLHDLDIGTIERTDGQGAIHRELHVAGARGFGPGSRNVFAEIGSWDDLFRQEHPIIGQKHDLDQLALVFVNPFHLDIEEGTRIYENLGRLLNHARQACFIGMLDVHEGMLETTVVGIGFQGYECI